MHGNIYTTICKVDSQWEFVDWLRELGLRLCDNLKRWPHGLQPTRLLRPWDLPGKSTGVGCHYRFPYSGLSYEWTHMVCGFLWLALFTQCNIFRIQVSFIFYHILVVLICHFLLLNNIPWCECTTFSLSIISWTLVFFYSLAIMNNATVDFRV